MLEIFAVPYFAISGVIGWVIFEPFFRRGESESFTLVNITTTDLLAVTIPISLIFLCAGWILPENIMSLPIQLVVIATAMLFAVLALILGLFLLPDNASISFFKRMAVVGIITPIGILLTLGWIGLLIWAGAHSMLYLAPSSIAIAAMCSGLRILGRWVCRVGTAPADTATDPPV